MFFLVFLVDSVQVKTGKYWRIRCSGCGDCYFMFTVLLDLSLWLIFLFCFGFCLPVLGGVRFAAQSLASALLPMWAGGIPCRLLSFGPHLEVRDLRPWVNSFLRCLLLSIEV